MTEEIRLWGIDPTGNLSEIQRDKLSFEDRLERWILNDITILSDNLLIIGNQVQTFGGPLDILCLDSNGDTVIVELKRGMTPREVTAQALDYSSCIKDLSADALKGIALGYFEKKNGLAKPLEEIFKQTFGQELPDDINQRQRIIIVGSNIDDSTERIIHYLSETYDVPINALTFQYFKNGGHEYMGRVFLLDPEISESKLGKTGTRTRSPYLTYEELTQMSKVKGVSNQYSKLWESLRTIFSGTGTNVTSLTFNVKSQNGRNIVLGLVPIESDEQRGLKFYLYAKRLMDFTSISKEELIEALPKDRKDWVYTEANRGDEFWSGYMGYFKNMDEVNRFIELIRSKRRAK